VPFLVQPTQRWQAWQAARRMEDSRQYAMDGLKAPAGQPVQGEARRPVPLGWALLLFAGSAGYLWWQRQRRVLSPPQPARV
jgi:hypothetical protein